jgi:hypothetical protein
MILAHVLFNSLKIIMFNSAVAFLVLLLKLLVKLLQYILPMMKALLNNAIQLLDIIQQVALVN